MNRGINDAEAAAILAGRALVEIRYLTRRTQPPGDRASVDNLDRIRFLADLCTTCRGSPTSPAGIERPAKRGRCGGPGTQPARKARR